MLRTPPWPVKQLLCLRLHDPQHHQVQGTPGKSSDFSELCLIPEMLANSFSPMFSGYIKSPLLVDAKGETVGANGGQTGRQLLQSRPGGVRPSWTNLPLLQKREGREIR